MNDYTHGIISKVIDLAFAEYPWDAGYRIDIYRAVAEGLIELADGLEEVINE